MYRYAFVALLAAAPVWADFKITGETAAKPYRLVELTAAGAPAGAVVLWDVSDDERIDSRESGAKLLFVGPPGVYRVKATAVSLKDGQGVKESARVVVTIGESPEPPPGPQPPGPDPDPFHSAAPGLKALIVVETADLSKLPKAQAAILTAAAVREYLSAKCVKEGPANWPAYRVWDKDVSTAAETSLWQKAMAAPRKSLPWLMVGNGKRGYAGPLPATVDETLALLRRFGGP